MLYYQNNIVFPHLWPNTKQFVDPAFFSSNSLVRQGDSFDVGPPQMTLPIYQQFRRVQMLDRWMKETLAESLLDLFLDLVHAAHSHNRFFQGLICG